MDNTISNIITPSALGDFLNKRPDEFFVIDLMGETDYAASHIPCAVNIPVEELNNRMAEVPRDKTVIVACRRGLMKSDMALEQLRNAGITNAAKIEGGTTAWFAEVAG